MFQLRPAEIVTMAVWRRFGEEVPFEPALDPKTCDLGISRLTATGSWTPRDAGRPAIGVLSEAGIRGRL